MKDVDQYVEELIEERIDSVPLMRPFLHILRAEWKEMYDELNLAMSSWGHQEYVDNRADYADLLYEMEQERKMGI